jgi:hypothetical protein
MAWQLAIGSTADGKTIAPRQVQNKFDILKVSSTENGKGLDSGIGTLPFPSPIANCQLPTAMPF